LCFDVGANIGGKTEKFLSYGASVICIEPQLLCRTILESKFSTNDKVKIVKTSLGSSVGTSTIFISDEHTLSTMSSDFMVETTKQRFKNTVWGKEETVDVSTLDNMINLYGLPKYCKIDVEGYEVEILKGLSNKIKYISVEFVPELKQKTFECIDLIDKLGDYKYNYIEEESEEFIFNDWVDNKTIIDSKLKSKGIYQKFQI
jgi:FkbM family methyltransferase